MQQLDRLTNQIAALRGAGAAAQKDANAATGGIMDGVSGLVGGLFGGGD